MNISLFIQARMSSSRLPGKMLKMTNGKALLRYVADSVAHANLANEPIVLTSTDGSDDPLADYCKRMQIKCIRGPLDNVAQRFISAIEITNCDAFVRICGDSPLLDYRLIQEAVSHFIGSNYDLVTNVFPRSYPSGQSVEVVRSATFIDAYSAMRNIDDLEHVTRYFYNNHEKYSIYNLHSGQDYSEIKLSIDTEEDFLIFKATITKMDRAHYEYNYQEIIAIYNEITANQGANN